MSAARIEAAALALTGDKQWPTNEELGGGPTGTRDDEFKDQYLDDARRALAAADASDRERNVYRVEVAEEAIELAAFTLSGCTAFAWGQFAESDKEEFRAQSRQVLLALADQPSDTNWGDQAGAVL